jgi:hypothetical protein
VCGCWWAVPKGADGPATRDFLSDPDAADDADAGSKRVG